MILVDRSVWVDHLQAADRALVRLLEAREGLTHPFVIGELVLGGLRQRELIGNALRDLPHGPVASDQKVLLHFSHRHQLFSSGIGHMTSTCARGGVIGHWHDVMDAR